jgi:hypothetical protein
VEVFAGNKSNNNTGGKKLQLQLMGYENKAINFIFSNFSRRPIRATAKDITKLSNAGSNHDCGSLSRVVMVRKTDQRVISHKSQKVKILNFLVKFGKF